MALTFKQISGISGTNLNNLPSSIVGSFLLATVLAGPIDGGTAPSNISDGVNTWVPSVTDFSGNNMNYFYCASNVGGDLSFSAVGATGTVRFWITEFAGQGASPIAGASATGRISNPSTGWITGLPKNWTNLASIISCWSNPPSGSITSVDGGAGTVILGNVGGDGAPFVAYNPSIPNGPGTYSMAWTEDFSSPGAMNGGQMLIKSSSSVSLGGGSSSSWLTADLANSMRGLKH